MKYIFFLFIVPLIIFGCNSEPDFSDIVPIKVDTFARTFIDNVHDGNTNQYLQSLDSEMQTEDGKTFLSNVTNGINSLKLDSIKIVRAYYTVNTKNTDVFYSIDYEQVFNDYSIFFIFTIKKTDRSIKITGFDARRVDAKLKETHSFSLSDRPIQNYVFLSLTILITCFILLTVISIIRSPIKRKWLWIIGVLITFVTFSFNWSTGVISFQLFSAQILGAGFAKSGTYGPWILSFSLPIIAIIYWIKKIDDDDKKDKLISKNKVHNKK